METRTRTNYLFNRFTTRTITEAEFDELLIWLYGLDEAGATQLETNQQLLWEKAKAGQLPGTADQVNWDQVLTHVLEAPEDPQHEEELLITPITTPVRRLWPRIAAAAAILFAISLGAYYFLRPAPKQEIAINKPTLRAPETILPNTNQTILTLANGKQIILDSAANGNLAGAANVIKLQDGELSYAANGQATTPEIHTISVPRGGRPYQLQLADGSRIWLNAASTLRYPAFFTGDKRTVELTGEGYFEVAKNAAMPFHVTYNSMDVEVLGTHFNVMAYGDESIVQTTLLEGSVKVTNGNSSVLIKPGQQASLQNDNLSVAPANTDLAVAWVKGYFQFDKADIKTILRQVGRWYDLDIVYTGNVPTDLFSGKIERSLPLSGIVKLLGQGNIKVKVEDHKLIVL